MRRKTALVLLLLSAISLGLPTTLSAYGREIPYVEKEYMWHLGQLRCISWSPNGSQIATGSNDGTVFIRQTDDYSIEKVLDAPNNDVLSIEFDPTSSYLVAGTDLGAIRIWDARNFDHIKDIYLSKNNYQEEIYNWVRSISFSPDGSLMALNGMTQGFNVFIYSTKSWSLKGSIEYENPIEAVSFNPNGSMLAAGSPEYNGEAKVSFWNTTNWKMAKEITIPVNENHRPFISLDWDPNGSKIAVGLDEYTVSIVDFESGTVEENFIPYELDRTVGVNDTISVDWSPCGQYIAASYDNNKARVWTTSGEELLVYDKHTHDPQTRYISGVHDVQWSPDGEKIASGGSGGSLQIWTLEGEVLFSSLKEVYPITCVDTHPFYGSLATSDTEANIFFWNFSGPRHESKIATSMSGTARTLKFSPDGSRVAMGIAPGYFYEGMVAIWDTESCEEIWRKEYGSDQINSLDWTEDGGHLVIGKQNEPMLVYNTTDWSLESLKRYTRVLDIDISSDMMAIVSDDGLLSVINTENWSLESEFDLYQDNDNCEITSVSISPGGDEIAFGTSNGSISIYDRINERLISTWEEHESSVTAVAWDPKDEYIMSSGEDGKVNLWNINKHELTWSLSTQFGEIKDVRWNDDGNRAVYVTSNSITVLSDGTELRELPEIIHDENNENNQNNETNVIIDWDDNSWTEKPDGSQRDNEWNIFSLFLLFLLAIFLILVMLIPIIYAILSLKYKNIGDE